MTFKKTLLASTSAALILGAGMPALAAGTAADTEVINSIDVNYNSDTTPISMPNAASDTFRVDEKVNFALVAQNGTTVSVNPTDANATLTFLLTNSGNEARSFDIDVAQSDNGDPMGLTYDPTNSGAAGTWSFYTSPNATGGPDTGYNPNGVTGFGPVAADGSIYLKIKAHVPEGATQGQEDTFNVTVRPVDATGTTIATQDASFDPATTEIVFGDIGFDGTEESTKTFFVNAAMITATKTVALVSENRDGTFDCANDVAEAGPLEAFIPGACVEYTITLKNDAGAGKNADNFRFTDIIPSGVSYVNTRDNTGFDEILIGAGTVTGTVNSMAPGGTATVKIRARID